MIGAASLVVALGAALSALPPPPPWLSVPPGFDTVARLYEVPANPVISEREYIFDLGAALTVRDCPAGVWRGRALYRNHIGGELRYEGTFLACFPYGMGVARYPDGSAWAGMVDSFQRIGAPTLVTDTVRLAVPEGGGTLIMPNGAMQTGFRRAGLPLGPDPLLYAREPADAEHLQQVTRLMALLDGADGQHATQTLMDATWARSGTTPLPPQTPVLGRGNTPGRPPAGPDPLPVAGGGGLPQLGGVLLPSVPSLGAPPPRPQPAPYTPPTAQPLLGGSPNPMTSSAGLVSAPSGSEPGRCLTGNWRRPNCGDGREATVRFSGGDRGQGEFRDNDCARVCPDGRSFSFDYQIVAPGVMQVDYTSGQICGQPVTPRGGRQPFTCAPGALKFGNDYTR